jgi:hypothetical protein
MRANLRKNQSRVTPLAVTIAAATTSSEIALEGRTICGMTISALTTAVSCTFTVATATGGTFYTLTDKDGTAFTVTLADDKYVYFDPAIFAGVEYVKIVLNASGSLTSALHFRNLE